MLHARCMNQKVARARNASVAAPAISWGVRINAVRARRTAVKVLAYRDTHREKMIIKLGEEVLRCWSRGMREGSIAMEPCVSQMVDSDVVVRQDQVLVSEKGKGRDYLRKKVDERYERIHIDDYKVLATAACPVDDTFFALVEVQYYDKVLGDRLPCTAYKVVEMDVLYDDTCLRVMGIHERGQLAPSDVACIASIDTAHTLCSATPFPKEDVTKYPETLKYEKVLENMKMWCQARSTGQSEQVLDQALDSQFRLWDAYGLLPVLCDPERRSQPDACVVRYKDVKDIIKQTKKRYDIDCKSLDSAVSLDLNVGFNHWRSRITNRDSHYSFAIEGIEVEIFADDGSLRDIWMFRDPMDFERATLEGR